MGPYRREGSREWAAAFLASFGLGFNRRTMARTDVQSAA